MNRFGEGKVVVKSGTKQLLKLHCNPEALLV